MAAKHENHTLEGTNLFAVLGFVLAFVMPLLGIIFSIIALVQINKSPSQKGKGFAIAGLILGIVFCVLFLIWMLFIFLSFFAPLLLQ